MHNLTHLDLFSGIGGFALAAGRAGFRTVGFSEVEPYACRVLAERFPGVPNLGDVRQHATFVRFRGVDVVTAGYPCQPDSLAGKRRGEADDRWLWPAARGIIAVVRPAWFIGENVFGHVSMGLDGVLSDLESIGYAAQPFVVPACAVDAHHRRDRVWIIAYTSRQHERLQQVGFGRSDQAVVAHDGTNRALAHANSGRRRSDTAGWHNADRTNTRQPEADRLLGTVRDASRAAVMANAERVRESQPQGSERQERGRSLDSREVLADASSAGQQEWDVAAIPAGAGHGSRCDDPEWRGWEPEPGVGGSIDGVSTWLDRNKNLNETSKTRAREILRDVWNADCAEAIQRTAGRFVGVREEEILLALLCEHESDPNGFRTALACGEIEIHLLRGVWHHLESARSPHRREYSEQHAQQYSDALRELSRHAPSLYPQAWASGCWEDGVPRVAMKIPNRAHRLRGLGNAIVSQVAEQFFRFIAAIERGENT